MAFKICAKGTCGVTVTDLNDEEYQTTSTLTASGSIYYTFVESSTVNVLTSISYDGEKTVQASEVTTHEVSVNDTTQVSTNVPDESEFDFPIDSLYEIAHIILPTKTYIDKYFSQVKAVFPNGVYFTDDGAVYKFLGYTAGTIPAYTIESVEMEELLEINTTGTTIIKEVKNTFSMCQLKACYNGIVKKLLEVLCGLQDCDTTTKYSQDIFNRDLLWMAINVIRYCIEQGQYFEAQRYLENIQACNTICGRVSSNPKSSSSCGCHQ
jgi:hypothetical protein